VLEHVTVTRYVTPLRSGLTADPAAELTHLFDTLVRI
jgi:hypothetical protein